MAVAPSSMRSSENFSVEGDDKEGANQAVELSYKLIGQQPSAVQLAEERQSYDLLRRNGHAHQDIISGVKWVVRYRPRAKRFSIIRLSIKDAFESRWSV